jgi:hypothetical protein
MPELTDRQRFEAHAAPEAITARLAKARSAQSRAGAEAAWLERLLAERAEQAEAGTWPPGREQQ